jgi:hypothetical protein
MTDDPIDRLAVYRPTAGTLDAEWPAADRSRTRAALLRTTPRRSLRFRPAQRRGSRTLGPVAAGLALLVLIGGVLMIAVGGAGRNTTSGAGPSGGGVETAVPGDGQYAYRYDRQIDLDANGQEMTNGANEMRDRSWVSPDGNIVSAREGSQSGCATFPRQGAPSLEEPTSQFFAGLPTEVDQLTAYLRSHVSGSSSQDEAVFVAVGDALREGDLLATTGLRTALVGVLRNTPGVTVHPDQQDYLGRPSVRVDFVDEQNRPGEIHSMYFDPDTYQFLEEREGSSGQPDTYSGPSPAYDAPPSASPGTPNQLTGAAFIDVMVEERVVDSIPVDPSSCAGLKFHLMPHPGGGIPNGTASPTH